MAKITEQTRNRGQRLRSQEAVTSFADDNFKQRLKQNIFVRFHMTLILSAVGLSGVTVSKLLFEFGVNSMLVRYPIAVCLAYGVFFLLVKLWLWYVRLVESTKRHASIEDGLDLISDVPFNVGTSGGQGSSWSGFGGGNSGGGGASDSWGETIVQSNLSSSSSSSGSSLDIADSALGILDLDDEGGFALIVLLAILAALLFGIFGAGVYLIYQSPVILAEAAFQAALASGLVKASKGLDDLDWKGSVFKATWLPFVIVLVLAVVFSFAAHRYCPAATKAAELFTVCRGRS